MVLVPIGSYYSDKVIMSLMFSSYNTNAQVHTRLELLHSVRISSRPHLTLTLLQVKQLEDLGYSGFAFGFFEDDVHFVGTSSAAPCSHAKVIQFLISLITASKCVKPCIIIIMITLLLDIKICFWLTSTYHARTLIK